MKLSLKLEEKQILSQQMRLSMQVLQMTSPELEQYLSELSLENPLLEVRPSRYRSEAGEFARFRSRARERDTGGRPWPARCASSPPRCPPRRRCCAPWTT